MADLPVAILVDIELQTLQLHNVLIRYIVNGNGGKIWKTRSGTEASELWHLQMHHIVPLRVSIRPGLQRTCLYFIYSISTRYAMLLIHTIVVTSSSEGSTPISQTYKMS